MHNLISQIERQKSSLIKPIIETRIREFEELGQENINEVFKELCFCLLTANFSASGGIKIQNEMGNEFLILSEKELAKKLSELGHRFPNARAKYIFLAREEINDIKNILESKADESEKRKWLVKNIKGFGMKEASHFLRNIGYKNFAIIDFHIIDLLAKNNLIEKPSSKSLTPKKYLEIENLLKEIAKKANLTLGELDLYLWHQETGKVMK